MANNYKQGWFVPKNPQKYVGKVDKIRYMSSWEHQVHQFFDSNPNVLRWASEEIAIPYLKPTDGKIHKYYPDYWVEYKKPNGETVQEIIEVKPAKQTKMPRANSKRIIAESIVLAVNVAKWKACQIWCKQHGMTFRLITENSIFK